MVSKSSKDERLDKLAIAIMEEMQFEQDLTDFREGKVDWSISIPTFAEVQEKFSRKQSADAAERETHFRQIPELLLTYLQSFFPQFQVQGALNAERFKSISVYWNDKKFELYIWRNQNGLEFYTPEAGLVGKSLIIKGNKELRFKFIADDTTEGMKASGFIKKEEAASLELNQSLKIGIED
jgi:hypothetical protein